jgi:TusA-related sulfurtransferase
MAIYYLDITKDHCPMTFVKTKIELNKLQKGDILNVSVIEGEPLENIPRSAVEQGLKVLSVKRNDDTNSYTIEIEK